MDPASMRSIRSVGVLRGSGAVGLAFADTLLTRLSEQLSVIASPRLRAW